MTPGDPEIYGNWIASKAPEPEVGEEEVGVIEGMDDVQDPARAILRGRFFSRSRESRRWEGRERGGRGDGYGEGDVAEMAVGPHG